MGFTSAPPAKNLEKNSGFNPQMAGWPMASNMKLNEAYGKLPLYFEPNEGQIDPQVRFLTRGGRYALYLTPAEAVFVMKSPDPKTGGKIRKIKAGLSGHPFKKPEVLRLRLAGGNRLAVFEVLESAEGKSNYLIGNDSALWRTGVAQYAKVRAKGIYPGIDMVYYGNQGKLEYDFVVAPGADPGLIGFNTQGSQNLEIDTQGNLVFHLTQGDVAFQAPTAYQEVEGKRRSIESRYGMGPDGKIGFIMGGYDKTLPLVIDPVLDYCTYLSGSSEDEGRGIAVDSGGNAYVVGYTLSPDFPTTSGAYQSAMTTTGRYDVYVAKINPTGTQLVYSTYLGGEVDSNGYAIAIDSGGNAYVTGQTACPDFPITPGAPQTAYGAGTSVPVVFVTKLNATGNALAYSTYLGGNNVNYGQGIAVDSGGNAYVTGWTASHNFPTTSGAYQTSIQGMYSVFVTKVNPTGTGWVYSTFLGGSSYDQAYGIALDASGSAYVTGNTSSTNFPTTSGAFQTTLGGSDSVFVSKLTPGGGGLAYSTYIGGGGVNYSTAIAVDSGGNAYVTGQTTSSNYPTTSGAFQTALGQTGAANAFLTKVNPAGTGLVYSTYLGGNSLEYGNGVAVGPNGNAYVTGYTSSPNFPTTPNALQSSLVGTQLTFLSAFYPAGNGLIYSTYFGGSDYIGAGQSVVLDLSGNVYLAGGTRSNTLPTTSGAVQTAPKNVSNTHSWAAKFDVADFFTPTPTPTAEASSTMTATPTTTATSTVTATPTGCAPGDLGWATMANLPTGRQWVASGVINGEVYVVGGLNSGSSNALEAYNPATNTWTTGLAVMPTARYGLDAGVVNGILYAVGGENGSNAMSMVEAYNPATNSWNALAPLPHPLYELGVAGVNGILYAIGGTDKTSAFNTVESYDPATNSWTTGLATMPTPRYEFAVGVLNGLIYAVGGVTNGGAYLTALEAYNPATNTWSTLAPLPAALMGLSVSTANGFLYALGGDNGSNPVSTVYAYNPTTNAWSALSSLPNYSTFATANTVNNVIYLVGGVGNAGLNSNDAGTWDCGNPPPTPSPTLTPTSTPTPTSTLTPTLTPLSTYTATPTPTSTITPTPALTSTPTLKPTPVPLKTNQAGPGETFLYPSPVHGQTATVAYYMSQPGTVSIRVWNIAAEFVAQLTDVKGPGPQTSPLSMGHYAAGVYLYKLQIQYADGGSEDYPLKQFVVIR
jgi:roadblock/LC7 domain-containing protein